MRGPFCDVLVADINKHIQVKFRGPLTSVVDSSRRALVNEAGFELFRASVKHQEDVGILFRDLSVMTQILTGVRERVSRFASMVEIEFSRVELEEALELGQRLASYFKTRHSLTESDTLVPLAGCGWLESCEIDVLANRTLYEIKSGDRAFLGTDIRQILIYLAASSEARRFEIDSVCLLNPRRGTYVGMAIDDLCVRAAGAGRYEVMNSIINLFSETDGYG